MDTVHLVDSHNNNEAIDGKELLDISSSLENEVDNEDRSMILEYQRGTHISCRQNFADCSNVFKAFIGSAMVGLPFATSKTGIAAAVVGIFIIAFLTDHCCILIVKCKKMIIASIVSQRKKHGASDEALRKEVLDLGRDLTFGRIAKVCLGQTGVVLTNISLVVTQLGFCIGYFIFLGNTMRSIVKYFLISEASQYDHRGNMTTTEHNVTSMINNITFPKAYYFEKFPITPRFLNSSRGFICLLLVPVPILILMAFVRNLRKLAPISVIANASLSAAFAVTSLYMLTKINSPHAYNMIWFNLSTFPILFGQVTAGFEGIGTVIPIESSMAENRQKYPLFLHLSVVGLSFILATFGIIGYVAFGSNTCQIINGNLTGRMSILLQVLLFVGVLFTYPMQMFPNIQLAELMILKLKKWRTKSVAYEYFNHKHTEDGEEDEQLMGCDSEDSATLQHVDIERWESNVIRASLVVFSAAVALVFRFQYAYIAAMTGSIGSSLLSYIIPALCHIHLTDPRKKLWKLKDGFLVVFGVIGGVSGVIVTVGEMIDSFKDNHPAHC